MSFKSIRTISFDATGTLFDPVPSIGGIYADVLQEHGVFLTEPELEMRFLSEFHRSRAIPLVVVDELAEKVRWQSVVRGILAEDYSEEIFEDLWQTMSEGHRWKTKQRLFRTLQALKDEAFRLVIVSNWDKRLHRILSTLKLTPYFETVFLSTELGSEKPSQSMYQKVAEELDADPSTLLHIGNSQANDYFPALRSGWNVLLLNNRIPHGMEPGTVLGSIDQLPEVLKSEKATR